MDHIVMKALKTFRGTNGYIPAGSEFYCTDQAMADMYVRQGLATFMDESSNVNQVFAGQPMDLKNIAQARLVNETSNKKEYKISEMERNVTSMAKPIELKVSVNGINPNDVDVKIVADGDRNPEEQYVSQSQVGNNQPPYETHNQDQGYQTQEFKPEYQTQEMGSQSNHEEHESKEKELLKRLEEVTRELEALHNEPKTQAQPQSQESPVYEVRHIGGGWYDLPNGERVQGKANAEARINELAQNGQFESGQESGGQSGSSFPNPDRVAQVNAQPQDGASLYRAQQEQSQGGLVGGGNVQGNNFVGVSGGYGEGGSNGGNQGGNYGNVTSQGGNQGGMSSQGGNNGGNQPRNSEGQFTSTGVNRTAGSTGTSGNTGGTAGGSGSTGSGGASTSGNTSGSGSSGSSGSSGGSGGSTGGSGGSSGASTSGNTNQ